MEVFISWSGSLSHRVALELKSWLKTVVQVLDPYVSSEDIDNGDRWFADVSRRLDECDVGIVCLTKENLHSDWLLFEAGALAKKLERGKVCTLLIDLPPNQLQPPLSEFQATEMTKGDVKKLIDTLHRSLPKPLLTDSQLDNQFLRCWDDFEKSVRNAIEESRSIQPKLDGMVANLVLPIIYRELDNCRVSDVFEWLQMYKHDGLFTSHAEIQLIDATLSRMCGKREAYTMLLNYPRDAGSRSDHAKFEIALLKYAKPVAAEELAQHFDEVEGMEAGRRKLWASLLGLSHLREGNMAEANRLYKLVDAKKIREDRTDAYCALQVSILAAAFGDAEIAQAYLDLARTINTVNVYPTNGYPYIALTAHHERAFVNRILGKGEMNVDAEMIKLLRGHSHVIAAHAHTLRLCEQALDTLVDLSSGWKKPLRKDAIRQRLAQFEKGILDKAGTLFLD